MITIPKRLTSLWLIENVRSFTADEWVAVRDSMRAKGWGKHNNNRDIEWFLWGCLSRETKRELDRRGLA
jgi:hypothetical protein